MTNLLPVAFGNFIDKPLVFRQCVSEIFAFIYKDIHQKVELIIDDIRQCLRMDSKFATKEGLNNKIKICLIKILQ